jgi:predicted transcriptional regulator
MVRLGELEQQVIGVLWASPDTEMTVREVAAHFPDHAYTTVLTVLDRLEHKGLVGRDRAGRAHRYSASGTREAYAATLMREALAATPNPSAVLVHFAENVTEDEAVLLRQILGEEPTANEGRR